ncbi:MAG: aldolase [Phycisphaeraceae bacterium]|nr:aldolase [Phycisphaeraceae bacterium]
MNIKDNEPVFRPSRMLAKMRAGGVVFSCKANINDPRVIEIMGYCGYDAVWLCREHVPTSWETVEQQVRAAKLWNMDAVVRVSRGDYSDMIVALEMDATAVMVPHVFTAAEARQVARMTKFHPVGRRPWDGGNTDGKWGTIPAEVYMSSANVQRFNILQIEDPEALDELDDIAATPGIDMLLFGPADFSQGIGIPGMTRDPRVEDVRRRIADTCRNHGIFAGTVAGVDDIERYVEMGYQYLNVGADVICLTNQLRHITDAFAQVQPAAAGVYQA